MFTVTIVAVQSFNSRRSRMFTRLYAQFFINVNVSKLLLLSFTWIAFKIISQQLSLAVGILLNSMKNNNKKKNVTLEAVTVTKSIVSLCWFYY